VPTAIPVPAKPLCAENVQSGPSAAVFSGAGGHVSPLIGQFGTSLFSSCSILYSKAKVEISNNLSPRVNKVHLPDLIRGVHRRLEQTLEAELKPRGMSLHQYRVLEALTERNGLPMGDLAVRLFVDGPTLTKIIDRMVESAEVYRGPDPNDRRRVLIFLSRRGAAHFEDIGPLMSSIQRDILDRLGASDTAALTSLLSELLGDPVSSRSLASRRRETLNYER
jgi:DNA-binding MarR family transcriptional regulator